MIPFWAYLLGHAIRRSGRRAYCQKRRKQAAARRRKQQRYRR